MIKNSTPGEIHQRKIQRPQKHLKNKGGARRRANEKKVVRKNILYYQPQIIEELELKLANTPYEKYLKDKRHREKVIHLISTLYIKPFIDKRYERTDFIHLSRTEFLAPMYGEHYYKDIVKALEHASVIDTKKGYSVGNYTKAYKLQDRYIGCSFNRLRLPLNSPISGKMDAHREREKKGDKEKQVSRRAHRQLYAKLQKDLEKITIDLKGAQDHILGKMKRFLQDPSSVDMKRRPPFSKDVWRGFPKPPTEKECEMLLQVCERITGFSVCLSEELTSKVLKRIVNIYESEMAAVQMIHDAATHNGYFTFEIDTTSGRLHTNLTNLSSDLRKFIYLNGKEIKGTDLSNSQPSFLALLLLEKFGGRENLPDDVEEYVELCLTGKFYKALMKQDGVAYPAKGELGEMSQIEKDKFNAKKKKFKADVFEKIFFGRVPKKEVPHYIAARAFKAKFPTVWNEILEIKSNTKDFGTEAHAQLAIKLQNKEQDVMILKSAKECKKREIPILTLHDALYTTEEYIEEVCTIILEQFRRSYGVEPKLSPA